MLPLPRGVFSSEVVDPDRLADEFLHFGQAARATTQWQWARNAFNGDSDDQALLARGGPVREVSVASEARLGTASGIDPTFADAALYHIPYARGFQTISVAGATPDPTMEVSWTSEYPELVWAIFDYQYARAKLSTFTQPTSGTTLRIRAQIRLAWNDQLLPGTGPYALPIDTKYRGQGLSARSDKSACTALFLAPAGSHVVAAKAAQATAINSTSDDDNPDLEYLESPPNANVCLGSRKLIVLRFPFGGWLGA